MSTSGLRIIILLTLVVGYLVPVLAQVEPQDSIPSNMVDSTSFLPDTLGNAFDTSGRFSLSTDSIYLTPISDKSGGFLSSEVEYTAEDSIIGSPGSGQAFLYNKAYVKYEDITLKAGFIRIDFDKNEVFAEGIPDTSGKIEQKPIFTEAGKSYRADNMRYNFESKKAYIKKVITQEGEGFLHGEKVKKVNDNVFFVRNAAFTTCSHEHPHFNIKTQKAKVISGDKVVTQFAYIEVIDVPTPLMIPFGFFPTTEQRKSGIIIPSYGNSEFRGYFLRDGGYYWAINDYLDFTGTGDFYTQGGYGIKTLTNYKTRYKYSGNFAVNYNLIRFGREEFQPFVAAAFDNRSDFSVTWNHQQDAKARPDFRFNANVNIASSNYYKVTSTNTNDVLNNRLNSSISMTKTWLNFPFSLNVSARHSQNNQTQDLTIQLPQLTLALKKRYFPFQKKQLVGKKKWFEEIGLNYSVDARNEIQTTMDETFDAELLRTKARNGVRHSIPISANYKVFKNFVLTPQINVNHRWYFQRNDYSFNADSNQVVTDTLRGFFTNTDFQASTNLSTKVYGLWRYKGYLRALRHVMTPRIGLSYRPDFSDDFFGYYQRVQVDTLGNTELRNQYSGGQFIYGSAGQGLQGNINFGLQNTLEAKVRSKKDSTGLKKIKILERVSLNTAYNMAATEFNWSNLNLTASSSALDGLVRANYTTSFDFYGYDEELNQRVNQSAFDINGVWLRQLSQNLTLGLNLSPDRFEKKGKKKKQDEAVGTTGTAGAQTDAEVGSDLNITEGDVNYYTRRGYVDFDAPWTLNINYNINERVNGLDRTISQSMQMSGDVQLTESWKVGFSTGYDFEANGLTPTSFNVFRDLHCWELRCNWFPFGIQQSYTLTIRVKANILQDLKLERRRGIGDFDR